MATRIPQGEGLLRMASFPMSNNRLMNRFLKLQKWKPREE